VLLTGILSYIDKEGHWVFINIRYPSELVKSRNILISNVNISFQSRESYVFRTISSHSIVEFTVKACDIACIYEAALRYFEILYRC
jgi:hypothetical protein